MKWGLGLKDISAQWGPIAFGNIGPFTNIFFRFFLRYPFRAKCVWRDHSAVLVVFDSWFHCGFSSFDQCLQPCAQYFTWVGIQYSVPGAFLGCLHAFDSQTSQSPLGLAESTIQPKAINWMIELAWVCHLASVKSHWGPVFFLSTTRLYCVYVIVYIRMIEIRGLNHTAVPVFWSPGKPADWWNVCCQFSF